MINPDIYVTIAQSTKIQKEVYWILVVCILLIFVLVIALLWLRVIKRWQAAEDAKNEGMFTLQDLREMRMRGDISQSEYNKLRDTVIRNLNEVPTPDTADPVVWEAEGEDGEVVWEADREEDGGWPDAEDDNPPRR